MGALLTLTECARWLRMRDAEAVRWLDQRDLIHDIDGRPRVIEADLLAELRAAKPRSLPARRPLARATVSAGPEDRELAGARPRAIRYGDVTATVMKRDGVLRREDGRYYWRARRGGAQISVSITIAATGSAWGTRAEADAAVHEAVTRERLVEAGHAPPPDDELTVAELLDSWIETREARTRPGQRSRPAVPPAAGRGRPPGMPHGRAAPPVLQPMTAPRSRPTARYPCACTTEGAMSEVEAEVSRQIDWMHRFHCLPDYVTRSWIASAWAGAFIGRCEGHDGWQAAFWLDRCRTDACATPYTYDTRGQRIRGLDFTPITAGAACVMA